MPMCDLIDTVIIIQKKMEGLLQFYKDDSNDNIKHSESFKYKIKITGKNPAACITRHIKIAVPLKFLSNFWRSLEIP